MSLGNLVRNVEPFISTLGTKILVLIFYPGLDYYFPPGAVASVGIQDRHSEHIGRKPELLE